MSPNHRIFLNIIAIYGRSLYALVNSLPVDAGAMVIFVKEWE